MLNRKLQSDFSERRQRIEVAKLHTVDDDRRCSLQQHTHTLLDQTHKWQDILFPVPPLGGKQIMDALQVLIFVLGMGKTGLVLERFGEV